MFPVLDDSKRLVGIITLEDLAAIAVELDLDGLVRAADVMRPPVALRRSDLMRHALETMHSLAVRDVLVVDAERRVLRLIDAAAIAREYMRMRSSVPRLVQSRRARALSIIRTSDGCLMERSRVIMT
jgi:CIC family chloride channel protein